MNSSESVLPESSSGDLLAGRPRRHLRQLELLVALVGAQVLQSFLHGGSMLQRGFFNVLIFAVVVSAVRTLSRSKVNLFVSVGLGIVAFAGSWVAELYPSTPLLTVVYSAYLAVFLSLAIALSESVFSDGPADSDRILGAIALFFVLGLIWAFIYSLLGIYEPTAFIMPGMDHQGIQPDMVTEFIYFSNVTLTTLGYGDIVPVSKPARMLASLEAMSGQLFVAIVIARLVGLRISQSRNRDSNSPEYDSN